MSQNVQNVLLKESIVTVGENRGVPRIWIEGNKLLAANFSIGRSYDLEIDEVRRMIKLKANILESQEDSRKVAKRGTTPVIDLCRKIVGQLFGSKKVRVQIFAGLIIISQPYHEALNDRVRNSRRDVPIAFEYFAGGGTLAKAVVDAGF